MVGAPKAPAPHGLCDRRSGRRANALRALSRRGSDSFTALALAHGREMPGETAQLRRRLSSWLVPPNPHHNWPHPVHVSALSFSVSSREIASGTWWLNAGYSLMSPNHLAFIALSNSAVISTSSLAGRTASTPHLGQMAVLPAPRGLPGGSSVHSTISAGAKMLRQWKHPQQALRRTASSCQPD